jgi:hypothetical protein
MNRKDLDTAVLVHGCENIFRVMRPFDVFDVLSAVEEIGYPKGGTISNGYFISRSYANIGAVGGPSDIATRVLVDFTDCKYILKML